MEGHSTSHIRQAIKSEISKLGLSSKIRDELASSDYRDTVGGGTNQSCNPNNAIASTRILQNLKSQGIVDSIVGSLQSKVQLSASHQPTSMTHHIVQKQQSFSHIPMQPIIVPGEDGCYLMVELVQGRAFIEQILEANDNDNLSVLTFHLSFRQHRFRSKQIPSKCDPEIHESFMIKLTGDSPEQVTLSTLVATRDPIHLVVVKRDLSTGESRVISSIRIEWRVVLCSESGSTNIQLELYGIGAEAKIMTGILEIRLELLPHPTQILQEDIISSQISLEKAQRAERERVFLTYAKSWWKEYIQIKDSHSNRSVKIFAQDENGENRFVCSFVRVLRAGRLLENPRQCARFVCSIPFEKAAGLGTGPKEQWATGHAFLARNQGDIEDHAVLLCSLLLGFGLEAYVAVGTLIKTNQQTSWVVTIQDTIGNEAVFWDPVKGKRFHHKALRPEKFPEEVPGPGPNHPYQTIGCLFNHRQFFANNHPTDCVEVCVFNLKDESRWKSMSADAIQAIVDPHVTPSVAVACICPSLEDPIAISNNMEHELRRLTTEFRRDRCDVDTTWDASLSHLMTQALFAYELEQSQGIAAGNEEFQAAVRRYVQDGHTFKAYPLQVFHTNSRRALLAALKNQTGQEVIYCRGDLVRLALRVRVYSYAESSTATWIMFACTYKSVP